ncbi:hypothetical protein ES695_13770 [Candidatus Atribacteria bacterium 1244-E10-H5-B2]|nr:MAG: hypothetical protein ES695_13770 [Candidatus Atribacteria bacterium 1244-E10-H5-B2]
MNIRLPIKLKPGGQKKGAKEEYIDSLRVFAEDIKEAQRGIDFQMSARGWCYIMEQFGLEKSDFDDGEQFIKECRIYGFLKPGFILEEEGHKVVQQPDESESAEDFVKGQYDMWQTAGDYFKSSWEFYNGISFWEAQDCYIQLLVEKVDLKSLFMGICNKYKIPIANLRGSGSIEQKAVMAMNFQLAEEKGKKLILFACGDFDPPGQEIRKVLKGHFEKYSTFTGWDPKNLIVDPIGLTFRFIQENNLTWIDNLESSGERALDDPKGKVWKDNRFNIREYVAQYGAKKCEANAIVVAPKLGRKMLQDAVNKWLGKDAYKDYEEALEIERERARELIEEKGRGEHEGNGS